jgi:hypothetical protein
MAGAKSCVSSTAINRVIVFVGITRPRLKVFAENLVSLMQCSNQ